MREIILTFTFVFLAAFPGRTTFILILLAASTQTWRLILGSIPAFAIQCAVAVIVGQSLKDIPHIYLQLCAGLLFFYFAIKFWLDSKKEDISADAKSRKSISSIFILFFFAELGDVSQLAIASKATQTDSIWNVYWGATAAMISIVFIAVFAGRVLSSFMKPTLLQKLAAVIFFILASYLVGTSIHEFI